jgi:tetratricopeptide (TPR) repeat protein
MASEFMLQMKAARCMGRGDYTQALEHLKELNDSEGSDPYTLCMIARCYEGAEDLDSAIGAANDALSFDSEHFESLQLLSRVYLSRKDYEKTKDYVQRTLQNFPEPLPGPPRFFFWVLRVLSIFPAIKRLEEAAKEDLADPNKDTKQWYDWAKKYLKWYGEEFGEKAEQTVH